MLLKLFKKQEKQLNNVSVKKKKKKNPKKEDAIKYAMWSAGWDRKTAKCAVEKAKKEYGISYVDFGLMDLCSFPEEEWEQLRDERTERRLRKKAKKEKEYIKLVCEETGWNKKEAREKMQRAKDISGASFENYYSFQFWDLTEEQQKTYYTKGDVINLRRKYNTDSVLKSILRRKDATAEYLGDLMGRKWISNLNLDFYTFNEMFLQIGKVIYKPIASTGGRGITVFEFDESTIKSTYEEIISLPEGIIEEFIIQHDEISKFSKCCVNTIRVVTICTDNPDLGIEINKVNFLFGGIRMAVGDNVVDNMHQGGLTAEIDMNTGIICSDGINYKNEVFEVHPDTGAVIKGSKIPYFQEMKDMIENASTKVKGFIGWDIAITKTGPVIIELNTSPGNGVLQSPHIFEKKGMKYVVEPFL